MTSRALCPLDAPMVAILVNAYLSRRFATVQRPSDHLLWFFRQLRSCQRERDHMHRITPLTADAIEQSNFPLSLRCFSLDDSGRRIAARNRVAGVEATSSPSHDIKRTCLGTKRPLEFTVNREFGSYWGQAASGTAIDFGCGLLACEYFMIHF